MSRPRLQVTLSPEEDQTLLEMRTATTVPQRTQDRAQALRLSHRGWTTEQIADYFDWQVETVRQAIHRWQDKGLGGLWDAPGRGRRPCWSEADIEHLEQALQQQQTYNSRQLAEQLRQERQVHLSRRQLRRILKKRATCGSEPAAVTAPCRTRARNASSKPT